LKGNQAPRRDVDLDKPGRPRLTELIQVRFARRAGEICSKISKCKKNLEKVHRKKLSLMGTAPPCKAVCGGCMLHYLPVNHKKKTSGVPRWSSPSHHVNMWWHLSS
jgi:hypothetical protein